MGRGLRIGLFFTALASFVPGHAWAGQGAPTFRLVVHDSVGIAAATLSEAREFSAQVFRSAGIEVVNEDAMACPASGEARGFCVQVLMRPRDAQFQPGKVRTMGVALAADQNRAVVSVYLDAVTDVARRYGQPLGKVLGFALAHEIGHVLLPPPSHSATGIMQPSWEGDALRHAIAGEIAFTPQQSAQMRERLTNRVALK